MNIAHYISCTKKCRKFLKFLGAIQLAIDIFGEQFDENSVNYFLSSLLAGTKSFSRFEQLTMKILFKKMTWKY